MVSGGVDRVAYREVLDEEMIKLLELDMNIDDLYITKEKFSIDIDELIERSTLSVEYEDFRDDLGGQLNTELRSLKINNNHNQLQQKFTKTRALGLFLNSIKHESFENKDINI